jgi:hypothetical protein
VLPVDRLSAVGLGTDDSRKPNRLRDEKLVQVIIFYQRWRGGIAVAIGCRHRNPFF